MQRWKRSFQATDLVVLWIHLFFAAVSFAAVGKATVQLGAVGLDRAALGGIAFVLSALVLLYVLPRLSNARSLLLQALRVFYPQLLYAWYFPECIYLSQLISGGKSFDGMFAQLDQALFGLQPALHLSEALGRGALLNELFFFSYFFFYVLITVGFWVLFFRGERVRAARCVFIVTASFAVLYVWYVFFPVYGPKYFIDELHTRFYTEFRGYLFVPLMTRMFHGMNLAGAAFPSSHVAVALVALYLNARYLPRLAALFAPFTLLLLVSTVYIYAHYVVDVVGGLAIGALLIGTVPRLYPCCNRLAARALPFSPWRRS